MTILYTLVGIVGLLGNTLVLYILYAKPQARTTMGFMFANMAAADLIVAVFIVPWSIVELYIGSRWLGGAFGTVVCKFLYLMLYASIAATIITLMIMSLDRFCGIVFPFKRITVFRKAKLVTALIWLSSFLLMVPVCIAAFSSKDLGCIRLWKNVGDVVLSQQIFFGIIASFLYALPLLVMAVLYSAIGYKLWIHKTPGEVIGSVKQKVERNKRKVIRMLVIIVVVFALCWLPPHILHIWSAFYFKSFDKLISTTRALLGVMYFIGQANSAINPCLYLALNTQFRKAFLEIIHVKNRNVRPTWIATEGKDGKQLLTIRTRVKETII